MVSVLGNRRLVFPMLILGEDVSFLHQVSRHEVGCEAIQRGWNALNKLTF